MFENLKTAHTQFGPETALARHSLRPRNTLARNNFSPKTTLAQRILKPAYILRLETLRPDKLWPTTLRPGDQTFKSVIFHHFWPSTSLGGAPGWSHGEAITKKKIRENDKIIWIKAITPPSQWHLLMIIAFSVSLDMIYIIQILFWCRWLCPVNFSIFCQTW